MNLCITYRMQEPFNKLFDYFFSKLEVSENQNQNKNKNKNYICSEGFKLIEQNIDISFKESIMHKLIMLFPMDTALYSKMGNMYKSIDIQKAILWHTIGYSINPMCQENTIHLCRLFFENGFTDKVFELNKNDLFQHFMDNSEFLGIYARCHFQKLYYKDGIQYLEKLIDKNIKNNCVTKEEKLEKWKNYHDMGYVYCAMGQHKKSLHYTKIAVELANKFNLDISQKLLSFSNLLFYKNYGYHDNAKTYEMHLGINDYYSNKRLFSKHHKKRKELLQSNKSSVSSSSKIRIGYVSGDYKYHPVANFIVPILENHDKTKFEIYVYANQPKHEVVNLFTNLKLNIYYIHDQTDHQVSELVHTHKIDILFDLSGHSILNRLGVFALSPSPIQITYLGYPNTSGLNTMHYRITDYVADNTLTNQSYSETLIRVPKCFLLYKNVLLSSPIVPKKTETTIILAAINKENKNSSYAMNAWKEILRQCSNTKLMIKIETFDNNEERIEYYTKHLETTPDRIIIINKLQNKEYNELFTKFDILLDTFPYSGTTTTCNTLYNSVPMVTLYHKDYHSHNVSASILSNASLSELIAYSGDEYIDIVKQLVNNPSRIDRYKREIGTKFAKSMEPSQFMVHYENILMNVYNKHYFDIPFSEIPCDNDIFASLCRDTNQTNMNTLSNDLSVNCKNDIPNVDDSDLLTTCCPSILFISVFDYGSLELGLNHLYSLKKCNILNYMAYVTDDVSYQTIKHHNFNVTKIPYSNTITSSSKHFGTKSFTEFSFVRYKIITEQLKQYDAIWYMDVDTVVLQDLNVYYETYKNGNTKYDIIYQNDIHEIKHCTGCVLYFSNERTINATQLIYNEANPNIPDQHCTHYFLKNTGKHLNVGLFESYEFPNGLLYFDDEDIIELHTKFRKEKETYTNNKNKTVAFVHANWMIGIENKIRALKKKQLWFVDNHANYVINI